MKKGFTLAEVLITLGIVGVVAAMTIPMLIQNYQATVLQVQFKRAYSILSQALLLMEKDTGITPNRANYAVSGGSGNFVNYFRPYFLQAINCDKRNCVVYTDDTQDKVLSGGYVDFANTYKLNNKEIFDDSQILLNDGTLVMIENSVGNILLTIDINGLYKKPNRWGHDLFTFQLSDEGKLLPMGAPNTTSMPENFCVRTKSKIVNNGLACTYAAFSEKDYFKNLPK